MCDNFFKGCPPKMGGFREITEYKTNAFMENDLQRYFGTPRDDMYRVYLQQNGMNLMNNEWIYLRNNHSCFANRCIYSNPRTLVPPVVFTNDMHIYNNVPQGIPCKQYADYRLF